MHIFKTIRRVEHYFSLLPLYLFTMHWRMFPFLVIFCLHIDVLTFVPFIYNKTRLVTRCKMSYDNWIIKMCTIIQIQDEKGQIWEGKGRKRVEKLCLFFSYPDHHLITILCSDFSRKLCLIFFSTNFLILIFYGW